MSSEEFNKILAGIPNKELVEKIHNHLTDMCKNREVFTMTIPPDPYRDFDILLGELIRRFNKQSLPVEAQVKIDFADENKKLKEALAKAMFTKDRSKIKEVCTNYDPAGNDYEIDFTEEMKEWAKLCEVELEKHNPLFYSGRW